MSGCICRYLWLLFAARFYNFARRFPLFVAMFVYLHQIMTKIGSQRCQPKMDGWMCGWHGWLDDDGWMHRRVDAIDGCGGWHGC